MAEEAVMWTAFAVILGIPAALLGWAIGKAAYEDRNRDIDEPTFWGCHDIDQRAANEPTFKSRPLNRP